RADLADRLVDLRQLGLDRRIVGQRDEKFAERLARLRQSAGLARVGGARAEQIELQDGLLGLRRGGVQLGGLDALRPQGRREIARLAVAPLADEFPHARDGERPTAFGCGGRRVRRGVAYAPASGELGRERGGRLRDAVEVAVRRRERRLDVADGLRDLRRGALRGRERGVDVAGAERRARGFERRDRGLRVPGVEERAAAGDLGRGLLDARVQAAEFLLRATVRR